MPDAKTLIRLSQLLGPETLKPILERIVRLARLRRVTRGARMRVDTTVVETNIHYPTDSSLLADGVRVLTRTTRRVVTRVGDGALRVRDRTRSVARGSSRSSRGRPASEDPAFPVETTEMARYPNWRAAATAVADERSLMVPVGLVPSNLRRSRRTPRTRARAGASRSGVPPSPSETKCAGSRMGRTGWYRHTPRPAKAAPGPARRSGSRS